ncbi:MAG: type II CAAX prenyl endopeptidase Rce1 family protein [Methanobrevibacter sp.]|uniref:CPBP family glutamic-type intramembrane protease n=1 Tax=Methanobrevibacter sp. TaxID=66852 RepID=UPI003F070503
MEKYFNFENKEHDIPYYNHNPRLSKSAWIVLLSTIILSFLCYGLFEGISELLASAIFCAVMLVPLMYYSNWDISLILRKPTKSEIKLAILLFIGYMAYALIMNGVMNIFLGSNTGTSSTEFVVNVEFIISLIFSMMGEELVKFIPFAFLMRLIYKGTNNRKLSITISTAIILVFFGLIHYDFQTSIISVLLLQGLGSTFEFYGYIKTKNLFVPYLSHILTDAVIFTLILFGLAV